MAAWTIELKISRIQLNSEDLTRLGSVLDSHFRDLRPIGSVLHSGDLQLMLTVKPEAPPAALEAALKVISYAFDEADLDRERRSQIAEVTMKPALTRRL